MPLSRTSPSTDSDCASMLLSHLSLSIDAINVVYWVAENFKPEEVFSEDDLEKWAISSGFTHS